MRNIKCGVADIRKRVFAEVARLAYEDGDYYSRMEKLPYEIMPGEVGKLRESIFLERAIIGERIRLAMGPAPARRYGAQPALRRSGGECDRGEILRSAADQHHQVCLQRLYADSF